METLVSTRFFKNAYKYSGGFSEGVTPVSISNTEVKSFSADGTARVTVWESRTLPDTKGLVSLSY